MSDKFDISFPVKLGFRKCPKCGTLLYMVSAYEGEEGYQFMEIDAKFCPYCSDTEIQKLSADIQELNKKIFLYENHPEMVKEYERERDLIKRSGIKMDGKISKTDKTIITTYYHKRLNETEEKNKEGD